MTDARAVLDALAEQHAELDELLSALDDSAWATPVPRCPGWTVADVVLHMAQTDEMAASSARGELGGGALTSAAGASHNAVDDGADAMVRQERGASNADLQARWRAAASATRETLAAADPKVRVQWVTNTLAPATLATTRLAECWIHTGDVAGALGIDLGVPAARLRHIAWLAWKTVPYAFERAGRGLSGPVAVTLAAPGGGEWAFGDATDASTTVTGPAVDWCLVAARRVEPSSTALKAEGPDATAVLELVRTYA
jgi:uncharacterized protein (TIGR03084 family)